MDLQQSISKQSDFSLSLAKHVITTYAKDKNLVFSPLSIHIAMSMVAAGSDGPTRDQLLGFLKSNSIEELNLLSSEVMPVVFAKDTGSSGPRLSLANGVWVDQSLRLKPAFQETVRSVYKGGSKHVDFANKAKAVRKEVNAWAEKRTKGLIKELIPPGSVTAETRLILANAVYFKATWEEEFDEYETKDREFFLQSGSSIEAPFMLGNCYQLVRAFDGFKVLRLPYLRGEEDHDKRRFSMYFFLPDAKDGLPDLLEKFGSESGFIENHIPRRAVLCGCLIPKFKIGFGFEASEIVMGLGVVHPFSGDGVGEMVESSSGGEALFISKILHKAFIEVNEQGTEAAAATEVEMDMGCCLEEVEEERIDFVADHPFLFLVREDISGAVLFVGQLLNPLDQ